MERVNKVKLLLWTILGFAAAVGVTRFIFGLGVTTNMSDNTPWGFWIGFDVMGGVALAGGGFVIAAFNYIFGKKQLHPIARAAILTAFLGYVAVAVGLLFDLGLPWNIWHMIIYWNPHSPLFEVGWCVMLYLTVLTLEFAPVVLEKYPNIPLLAKIHKSLYKIRIPLVVLGIMLSTLHQSSLGSLFLAMPYKLHPLWYSPIIPVIFFISAICLGFMMVMVESITSSHLYKKEAETHILDLLRKYASFALIFYIALRFGDILFRGAGGFLFAEGWGSFLFWVEMLFSAFIPLAIFVLPSRMLNIGMLYFGAISGVVGIVFNRLNVGGLTHLNNLTEVGWFYLPSINELLISAGVVSAAMLVFFFFIENFKVWEEMPEDPELSPKAKPKFNTFGVYLGPTKVANRTKFSFAFVIAFGVAFAMISGNAIYSEGFEKTPVSKARGADTLYIDGNRDGYGVAFPHKKHETLGVSCGFCHHLNKPDDKATGCYECHDDMFLPGDAFRHDWHASSLGANIACNECHESDKSKGLTFRKEENKMKICDKCHDNLMPSDSKFKALKTYKTVSYTDAMHSLCIGCHTAKVKEEHSVAQSKPDLAQCSACHSIESIAKRDRKFFEGRKRTNKWVVVPVN